MEKVNLFISYCHQDRDYLKSLKEYVNENTCSNINIWDDGKIMPGSVWDDEIRIKLSHSQIIILIISQGFLNSNYINNVEFAEAIKKHESNTCKIIPIFAKKCNVDKYPQLEKFQGLPDDRQFISDMGDEKYAHYSIIQNKINDLAAHIITDRNISNSINIGDKKSTVANEIEKLRTQKKIYLSLPSSEEGKKRRRAFLFQVEGKIKYENWPYEVVPGITDSDEIYAGRKDGSEEFISSLIKESIYSVHIITSENDLKEGFDKRQYDLANSNLSAISPYKNIIWIANAELKPKLEQDIIMNPIVTGNDYESIFDLIKNFDIQKEKKIDFLRKGFRPEKKIFVFYDYFRDHENSLRIKLKSKIEENERFSVWFSSPNASLERDKEDLDTCDGACIFYGATDTQWFLMRQMILRAMMIRSKAICLDEPGIEQKMIRDVMKNDFITIGGNYELELKVQSFLERLISD